LTTTPRSPVSGGYGQRGSGDYRLTFSFSSVASAASSERVIAFSGNFNTVPVNGTATMTAFFLDPRGYTLSGAEVGFGVAPSAGDLGTVSFESPASSLTRWEGSAAVTVRLTSQGKVQLAPAITSPVLSQWVFSRNLQGAEAAEGGGVARFAPVGSLAITPTGLDGDGTIHFVEGKREEYPVWRPRPSLQEGNRSVPVRKGAKDAQAPAPGAQSKTAHAMLSSAQPPASPPAVAMSRAEALLKATPLAEPLSPQDITSCATSLFVQAGVNAPAVQPPFTVTLTDLTPSTGQSVANGEVGVEGIHGHRIEKTIRLKIDVKDATGSAPIYPVLIHLGVTGPRHGTLILDPDGNRVECDQTSFLWHERDAQGSIIALNEELEYRLGTYAPYVGAVPDPGNPGQVKPVWGTGENLGLVLSTVDGTGLSQQLSLNYKVHPEPGKPDHFVSNAGLAGNPDPTLQYWSEAFQAAGAGTKADGTARLVTLPVRQSNAYYLADSHGNVTFGYTNLTPAPTAPAANVTLSVQDQTSLAGDYEAYQITLTWSNDPDWPQGAMTSTISVTYPTDPEWAGGTVSKDVQLQFDRGLFHAVVGWIGSYDGYNYYTPPFEGFTNDPDPPWVVSPGAEGEALPKVLPPTQPPYDDQPARASFLLVENYTGGIYWNQGPIVGATGMDSWAELEDSPSFRISLIMSPRACWNDPIGVFGHPMDRPKTCQACPQGQEESGADRRPLRPGGRRGR
jgi:hypothetical protein